MANNDNLKPIKSGDLPPEELKKRQSNGGKKSAEKRKRRKAFKTVFKTLLSKELSKEEIDNLDTKILEFLDDKDAVLVAELLAVAQVVKAADGDTKAFEVILDVIGEKPVEKHEIKHDRKDVKLLGEVLQQLGEADV